MDPINPTVEDTKPFKPSPKGNNLSVISMAIFVLFALSVVAFLYYQNQQLKSMLASYQTPTSSPTPTATSDPMANWKTYTNTNMGFLLKYPSDWDVSTINTQQINFGNKLTISSKAATTLDQFVAKNLPTDKTPAVDYTSGNIIGKKLIYKSGIDQSTVGTVIAFSGQNQNVITLSYTDTPGQLTLSETTDKILSTFKFISASPSAVPTTIPVSSPTAIPNTGY